MYVVVWQGRLQGQSVLSDRYYYRSLLGNNFWAAPLNLFLAHSRLCRPYVLASVVTVLFVFFSLSHFLSFMKRGAPAALYGDDSQPASCNTIDSGVQGPLPFVKTGLTQLVFLPPQVGPAFNQRIGARTRGINLEIRGLIRPTGTNAAVSPPQLARLMILYDRQPNGGTASVVDILATVTNAGAAATTAFSGTNVLNRDRFMTLRDRKIYLPAIGIMGATPGALPGAIVNCNDDNSLRVHEYIVLKNLESHYLQSSSPSLPADIATGAYVMLLICSDDTAGNGGAWGLTYESRHLFWP